ncbi:hypothetical protein PsorP6_006443 [Peronosclerospora sorghi]|uniref:Uncharacterized protein n=1 Tax=Peronosclerospora sorghi TaxID=230839 RepID=A0ACC0W4S8_9STRA|nr:hypothetical protein PsorP6_006443 [Peronosclerospora sorghi]
MITVLAKLFRQHRVNRTRAKSGTYTTLVKQRVQQNVLLGKIIQILGCKTTSDVESTTMQFDIDLIRGAKPVWPPSQAKQEYWPSLPGVRKHSTRPVPAPIVAIGAFSSLDNRSAQCTRTGVLLKCRSHGGKIVDELYLLDPELLL